jgi:hypothetical protein
MSTNRRFDWSYLLLYPYMAAAFIPWVKYHVQFRFVLPLMFGWALFAFFSRRQLLFPRKGTLQLLATLFFLTMSHTLSLLYLPFGYSDGMDYVAFVDLVMVVFPLIVLHLSICNGRLRELRSLVLFCFICLAISSGMNFFGESVVEGGSRTLTGAMAETTDLKEMSAALEAGIGGFGYIYGLALLVFPVVFCIKFMTRPMKLFFIFFAMLVLATVYQVGYSICIIGVAVAGLMCLIALVRGSLGAMKLIGVIVVSALVSVVANPRVMSFLLNPLQRLGDRVGKEEYQLRLNSVADAVAGNDKTYAVIRSELYWTSWRTFLDHPLFGMGHYDYERSVRESDNIGGHSLMFDMMGHYGLFGLSIFLLFFFFYARYLRVLSFTTLGVQWWPAYYIFLFSASSIAVVNPLGGYMVYSDFLLIIPALTLFFRQQVVPGSSLISARRLIADDRLRSGIAQI